MAKELTDDELNLRRKARRRLIGAIALTLAVVVVLPMVLESEPKSSGQDIELRIPAPDRVGEFVPGVVVSEVLPQAESAPESTPEPLVDAAPEVVADPVVVQPPAPKPVETPAAPAAEPVRIAEKIIGGYAAQVGAYSSSATAKQELGKLTKWGFSKAYTEQIGNKTRVRVGPYAEREQAEKVRLMLEKHGLHPVLVSIK